MITKTQIYLFIILCLFTDCTKDNDSKTEIDKSLLLYQMYSDTTLIREFSYTSDNLIFENKEKWIYIRNNYDNDRLISFNLYEDPLMYSTIPIDRTEWVDSLNTTLTYKRKFDYNDFGRICKSTDYYDNMESSKYMIYNYSDSNIVESISFYIDNKELKRMTFEYDGKRNLIKEKTFFPSPQKEMILSVITDYQLDSKKNPYFNISKRVEPGLFTNPNNITKMTTTDVELDTKSIIENKYLYNENGYPILLNGTIRYIYK